MRDGFLTLTGGVLVLACIAGFIASASQRKRRQKVSAGSPRAAAHASSACPPLPLHEVRILAVSVRNGRVLLTVSEISGDAWPREWAIADHAGPGVVAQLDGWCAGGATLLLFTDDDDMWQLLAPDGTTTGLCVCEVRA